MRSIRKRALREIGGWFIAAGLVLWASTAFAQADSQWSADIPPERFQGPAIALTVFLPLSQMPEACGVEPPEGKFILACVKRAKDGMPIMFLPLPCGLAETEVYSRIVCHELAHARTPAWGRYHER